MRRLALGCALVIAGCTYAPPPTLESVADHSLPPPAWRNLSPQTAKINDAEGLAALGTSFPDSSSVRLRRLQASFAAEDFAASVGDAVWLARRGYVLSEGAQRRLIAVAGNTAIAAQLKTLFARNATPKNASAAASTVPVSAKLAESLAIHPRSGKMIVSTVVSRQLFKQVGADSWAPINIGSTGSLSGLAFDPAGRFLWAAAGDLGMNPAETDLPGGMLRVELERNSKSRLFPSPDGVTLSDLTTSGSSVYASDPIGGGIYTLTGGSGGISAIVKPGIFRSPQGLAIDDRSRRMYVSDYRYGIGVVDLTTGQVTRLRAGGPMILDGIDGLWKFGNRLIGVQNGMSPMRIVAITLSQDGLSALDLEVLEQANPAWTEPLGGAIHDGALYYVATGQWDRFGEGGVPIAGKPGIPTEVRRLPL